jgi:tetratricopeptide (TPR) repeat protein
MLSHVAVERAGTTGFDVYHSEALAGRAEAYFLSGRLEEALQAARRGLELSRAGKQRGYEADTLHILGEIQACQQPPDEAGAEESCRQALALAEELGTRPLAARCHLGLGRLYRCNAPNPSYDYGSRAAALWLDRCGHDPPRA